MSTALDKSINIARRWRRQSCGWSWVVLLDGSEIMADREWSWVVAAKLWLFVDGHAWSHGLVKPLLGRILRTTFFASQKASQVVIIKDNKEFMNAVLSKKKKKNGRVRKREQIHYGCQVSEMKDLQLLLLTHPLLLQLKILYQMT